MADNPFEKSSDDAFLKAVEKYQGVMGQTANLTPQPVVEEPKEVIIEIPKDELEYQKILREHGGQESNIPIISPYWRLRP